MTTKSEETCYVVYSTVDYDSFYTIERVFIGENAKQKAEEYKNKLQKEDPYVKYCVHFEPVPIEHV